MCIESCLLHDGLRRDESEGEPSEDDSSEDEQENAVDYRKGFFNN